MPVSTSPALRVLLADGSLRIEAAPPLLPLLARWLPLLPYRSEDPLSPLAAVVRVEQGSVGLSPPPVEGAPTLRLGSVSAWVEGDRVRLAGAGAGCVGGADLAGGTARIIVPEAVGDEEAASWDVYSMATLSCALLLGRMGRALVHAAAVEAPAGGSRLLVGDARAGKSTTCANLVGAGWRFVSDDHVVLSRGDSGSVEVEGWPRKFHLDEGWGQGAPRHVRGEVDPHARWPGRWLRAAPLAGLLFPYVDAGSPTAPFPLAPADALAALLRQSPWLLADRAAAPGVLGLLQAAVAFPCHRLRLGLDTWEDPALLAGRIP